MKYFDKEEKDIIESIEKGEWKPINKKDHSKYIEAGQETFKKNKRINIRLSNKDFRGIQIKAMEEGLPYQSLITSLIHKYVAGKIKQVK